VPPQHRRKPSSPNTVALSSGLVGYWPLDGAVTNWGNNATQDLSGNGNTGTLTNMSMTTSPTQGKIGQGMNFVGGNRYILASNSAMLLGSSARTMSAWIRTSVAGPGWILDYGTDVVGETSGMLVNGGTFQATSWTNDLDSGIVVNDNKWHFVWKTYVDGVADATNAPSTNTISANLRIGERTDGNTSEGFIGTIDDVRIYNRALGPGEIMQLYHLGTANAAHSNVGISNGLVGYWPMDGSVTNWTTGQTADLSSNGNTGHISGMSTSTSPIQGKIGQALNFNGSSVSKNYVQTSVTQYTESAWIKTSSSGDNVIIQDRGSGAGHSLTLGIGLDGGGGCGALTSGGLYFVDDSTGIIIGNFYNGTLNDNKWHHVSI
jgi:hypothetical protein